MAERDGELALQAFRKVCFRGNHRETIDDRAAVIRQFKVKANQGLIQKDVMALLINLKGFFGLLG